MEEMFLTSSLECRKKVRFYKKRKYCFCVKIIAEQLFEDTLSFYSANETSFIFELPKIPIFLLIEPSMSSF